MFCYENRSTSVLPGNKTSTRKSRNIIAAPEATERRSSCDDVSIVFDVRFARVPVALEHRRRVDSEIMGNAQDRAKRLGVGTANDVSVNSAEALGPDLRSDETLLFQRLEIAESFNGVNRN